MGEGAHDQEAGAHRAKMIDQGSACIGADERQVLDAEILAMPAQMPGEFGATGVAALIRCHADHFDAPGLFKQRHGETLLFGLSELNREITLMKGLEIGELTISAGPFPVEISGQKALGLLAARHPGLTLRLRTSDWTQALEDVLHGRADLGFADISDADPRQDLATQVVRTSQLSFYCRASHPLAARTDLTLEDLIEFPWATTTAPARMRMVLPLADKAFGVFNQSDDSFRPRIVVETVAAAREVVLASDALSVTLPELIEREIKDREYVLLPIDLPWLKLNYGFFWKRGRTHSPAAIAFMQIVQTVESERP